MSQSERIALLLALLAIASVSCEENRTEVAANKTAISGKTYFIQLKKTGDAEEDGPPVYMKINHYKQARMGDYAERKNLWRRKYEEMFGKMEDVPENLKEAPYDAEEFSETIDTPKYVDTEWNYNIDHSTYDLPNITHDIYEAMLEDNKHNAAKNASTVKFFFEIDTNLTSNVIKFNVDSLEDISDKIVDAELHVYRLPRDTNATKPNSTENVVRLYQMTESGESSEEINSTKAIPDVHKLANVIYISANYAGWQVFKVKNVVENWKNGEDNLGFLISTTDKWENEDSVSFAHRERNGGKYQPTLVVYLDRQESANRNHEVSKQKSNKLYKPLKAFSELLSKSFNPCSRHVWYISFHELGWNNFIIAPTGYMAYKCKGSCSSPLTSTFTNHGKLVNVYQRNGDSVGACCVPSGYKSMLIMFYDKESNVVIKEYDDMIVSGCGCR